MEQHEISPKDWTAEERDQAINRYIELWQQKKELETQLEPVAKELDALKQNLAQAFEGSGDTKITRNGCTLFVKREITAKAAGGDTAGLCTALRKAKLHNLISANMSSLKSWLRERFYRPDVGEWVIDKEVLPPSVRDFIEVGEVTLVSCRKA